MDHFFFPMEKIYMHKNNKRYYAMVTRDAMFKDKEYMEGDDKWRRNLVMYMPLYNNDEKPANPATTMKVYAWPPTFVRTQKDFDESFEKVNLRFIGSAMPIRNMLYDRVSDQYAFNNGAVIIDTADFDKVVERF